MMFGDMLKTEDDKLAYALEIAFNEISKDKEEAGAAGGNPDESTLVESKQTKEIRKKNYLGTHAMIKLPYVIGTGEYLKHPYAGLVYLGNLGEDLEQVDFLKEEQMALEEDKKFEQVSLQKNADEIARIDELRFQAEQYEQ